MLLLDKRARARAYPSLDQPLRKALSLPGRLGIAGVVLWVFANVLAAMGWGGKVKLARKYRAGQTMVYATQVRTRAQIDSNPPALKNFFPPVPTDLTMRQQNTVTVAAVRVDGAADLQQRFDRFELQSDLAALPEDLRHSAKQA
jgi:hypothetical protein